MPRQFTSTAVWLALLALSTQTGQGADEPIESSPLRPIDLKQVREASVAPRHVRLRGRDSRQQLLVTGDLENDELRDLTRRAGYQSRNAAIATVTQTGLVRPVGNGRTEIVVSVGNLKTSVPVEVDQGDRFLAIDFTNDIAPIFTKRGCNGGGCHGKSGGRGGFSLSLFGFQPELDYESITKGARSRRIFPAAPSRSLLIRKPVMAVPHGGGHRLKPGEPEYDRLLRWIAASSPWGMNDAPRIRRLFVEPRFRAIGRRQRQQIIATAEYENGTRRDVTRLVEFRSNDPVIATVSDLGLVTSADRTGETAIVAIYQGQIGVSRILVPNSASDDPWPEFPIRNVIDRHAIDKLQALRVRPSEIADEATFLRRVSLQITGQLPSVDDVRRFRADGDPEKRETLVKRLVRRREYADHFAQKWSGILRNKRRGQKGRIPGTIAFHRWIRNAIATNMPYDRFVRGIITATGNAQVNPPAQWYAEVRYLDRYVDDTAQVFLGVRIGCARCHHHPFESYSQADYYGLAAFFTRVGRKGGSGVAERRADEVIFVKPAGSVKNPLTGRPAKPHGLGAEPVSIPPYDDPRRFLVDWMAEPNNPYFARAFVNRMWSHFFGRGLVEPPDDMRVTNPASNQALLDALAAEFVRSRFNMRHIVELICSSTTYQLSSDAVSQNLDETQNHSRFYLQRLSAEVLLDAIDQVTGNPTRYSGLPAGTRAAGLPDEDYSNKFLRLFGRPMRESACECERVAAPSLSQSLFVMNDKFILGKIYNGGYATRLSAGKRSHEEKVQELFLTALSREPTSAETENALKHIESESDAKTAYGNLLWALLNTKEFLYIH